MSCGGKRKSCCTANVFLMPILMWRLLRKRKPPFTSLISKDNRRYGTSPYAAVCHLDRDSRDMLTRRFAFVLIVVSCKNRVIFHTGSASRGRGMSRSMPS